MCGSNPTNDYNPKQCEQSFTPHLTQHIVWQTYFIFPALQMLCVVVVQYDWEMKRSLHCDLEDFGDGDGAVGAVFGVHERTVR